MRILVIDDDETMLALYKHYLVKYDPNLITCSNGLEGANELLKNPYDLVFVDLKMPFKTGDRVVQLFRETFYGNPVPVCVVSGYLDKAMENFLLKFKNVWVFHKPFNWKILDQLINDVKTGTRTVGILIEEDPKDPRK